MDKIKRLFMAKSVKTWFALYMLAGILLALLLSMLLSSGCQRIRENIYDKYRLEYQDSYVEMQVGPYPGHVIGYYLEDFTSFFTPVEHKVYNLMGFFSVGVYPICFILCIAATSIVFYKRQLQAPFAILDHAAGRIADNDLDFKIVYDKKDELGKLCASFEKMRQALRESTEEMWRQVEERKRLNAAFSHDLRTPLTVLKGQSELLRQYAPKMDPEKIGSTAGMMYRHIVRLEAYVQTMGDLQRLEDIEVARQAVTAGALCRQLRETGEAICGGCGKGFSCALMGDPNTVLQIDPAMVLQAYENLLANGARFAKGAVAVSMEERGGYLYLTVSDDGEGFTEKGLEDAAKPFYKTEGETGREHFGMGLYICKVLCEKHGGYIRLRNGGGAVVSAVFQA